MKGKDVGRVPRVVNRPGQDVGTLLNIQPIIADNTEIGVSFEHGGLLANIAYFWSASEFGQRLRANARNIFEVRREPTGIKGIKSSAEYDFAGRYLLGAGYAALEGRSDQDGDGRIDEALGAENISPDRLNLYAQARLFEQFTGALQLSHFLDRKFNNAATATDFSGYTLVDLNLGHEFDGLGRVELAAQNLLNEDYITCYSQAVASAPIRNNRFFAGRGRMLTPRCTLEL